MCLFYNFIIAATHELFITCASKVYMYSTFQVKTGFTIKKYIFYTSYKNKTFHHVHIESLIFFDI